MYRVKNWERHFEGAKTKTYNNKTTCSMPNKHGLGYRKLVKAKNGPAMFGAWCALLNVLSRHEIPRKGYCTDTGSVHGIPYTNDDLELVTDIPKKIFSELFPIVLKLGWVEVITTKDTTGIVQSPLVSPQYPLNSDSDSDSDSNSNLSDESFERVWALYQRKGTKRTAKNYWNSLSKSDHDAIEAKIPEYIAANPEEKFRKDFSGWINPANRIWENKIVSSIATPQPRAI